MFVIVAFGALPFSYTEILVLPDVLGNLEFERGNESRIS